MKTRIVRRLLVTLIFASVFSLAFPGSSLAMTLNQLLQRQSELQRRADESRRQLEQKRREVTTISQTIANIDSEIAWNERRITETTEQIQTTNSVIAALTSEIGSKQAEIDNYHANLSEAYGALFELSQQSTLEVLFQSQSLSDAVTRTQFIADLQQRLITKIQETTALRDQLASQRQAKEAQKNTLEQLNQELNRSRLALSSQKNQKAFLLNKTRGEQAQFEQLLQRLSAEQERIGAEIFAERLRLANNERVLGGTGGYPWAHEPNPWAVDPWLFFKRQCTSFAAWKFQSVYGQVFFNTRPGLGHAWNWPALARDQGYRTSSTPRVNSIVSWPVSRIMPWGHVAWVTAVHNDGTIDLEEYNWTFERNYSKRFRVNPARYGVATYIFP